MRTAIVLALIAAITGCSSGRSPQPPHTAQPTKVAQSAPVAALNEIGWFCDPRPGAGADFTASDEVCSIDDENVSIYTFATIADRESWRAADARAVCEVFAGKTFYTVERDLYVIAPVSEKMARDLAAVLPADLRTLNC